jgi:integrase
MATWYKAAKEIKGDVCLKCGQPLKNPKTGKMHYGIEYRNDAGKLTREHNRKWTKKDAEYRLNEIQNAKAEGDYIPQRQDAKTTFRDLAEWFIDLPKSKGKKDDDRKQRSLKHLLPFFGDRMLRDITPSLIENYICKRSNELSYRKHPTKPATIERELACMKKIINWAIDNGKAERSPFRRGIMPKNNARKRVLSLEEYPRFIAECPDYIKPVVKLAYYTGMRRGEILKLTWGMVDLKRRSLDLPPEICKTNEGRFVPLNSEMVEMFKAMPRGLSPDMPVFTRNGKPITGSTIREGWETACNQAGIDWQDCHLHDLRHTAKTNMLDAGVAREYRDLILGHKLPGMDAIYLNVSEDKLHQAMRRYTEWLSKAAVEALAKPNVH